MTHPRRPRLAIFALALPFAIALSDAALAFIETPVPRPAPRGNVVFAAFNAPARMGPALPLELAIRRELTVDVSLAVADVYAERGHRPIWTEAKARRLRERLAAAAGDGLDPREYRIDPALSGGARDVALSEAALRYARHAHSGRIEPASVSAIITAEPPRLDEHALLRRLARASDPVPLLEAVHPNHADFRALRDALRVALERRPVVPPALGSGPHLKRGSSSPRVAILRARLGATVPRGTDPTHFDDALAERVKAYQREEGLAADGVVGPRTRARIDAGTEVVDVASLVSNLERWRWLPRHLGTRHVHVNVPAFEVRVMKAGRATYRGKVIVGTPSNPTPIFSDVMEHVVVNPYWNVPYSIASKEMLGGIAANPSGYFRRRGYEAVLNGRVVNPASISWNAATLRKVRVRQRPGRGNALGAVKFLFPNKHAVYLHDTPTKHLFRRERRAYSHGCVRVDQPFDFAEALLEGEADLSGAGLRRMVGGGERWLNLAETVPVHLTYFTVEPNADGTLTRRADLYGFDRRTQRALGL